MGIFLILGMSDRSKEKIKFYMEWIKLLVIVEIALGSGIVSAIHGGKSFKDFWIVVGSCIFPLVILRILFLTSLIKKEIKKL